MEKENMKLKNIKLKDIVITVLFTIYLMIPLMKLLKCTSFFTVLYEYNFMEMLAIVGICFFIFEIYNMIKNNTEKKQIIKDLLPMIILTLYLIWTLISCIFALDKEKAFYGDVYRKDGYITYLIYGGFLISAMLISSDKIKKYLLSLFIIIVVLNITLINITNNSIEMLKIFHFKNIGQGVFDNPNHYGYYLTLATITSCILFIMEKNKILKLFYGLTYIIIAYNLILNNTLGCYLATSTTMIIFLIYCVYNKKYIVFSIISVLIFIVMSCIIQINEKNVVLNNFKGLSNDVNNLLNSNKENVNWQKAGSGRAKLWKYGIIIFLQKPILGYGVENLEVEYAKYDIDQDRPHNLLIQLATTSGIPGLLLYIAGIGLILIRGFKRLNESDNTYVAIYFAVIAYLISAMFGNSMYYTSPYFFMFLGFIMDKNFSKNY